MQQNFTHPLSITLSTPSLYSISSSSLGTLEKKKEPQLAHFRSREIPTAKVQDFLGYRNYRFISAFTNFVGLGQFLMGYSLFNSFNIISLLCVLSMRKDKRYMISNWNWISQHLRRCLWTWCYIFAFVHLFAQVYVTLHVLGQNKGCTHFMVHI